jgi:hypothetical protein
MLSPPRALERHGTDAGRAIRDRGFDEPSTTNDRGLTASALSDDSLPHRSAVPTIRLQCRSDSANAWQVCDRSNFNVRGLQARPL